MTYIFIYIIYRRFIVNVFSEPNISVYLGFFHRTNEFRSGGLPLLKSD